MLAHTSLFDFGQVSVVGLAKSIKHQKHFLNFQGDPFVFPSSCESLEVEKGSLSPFSRSFLNLRLIQELYRCSTRIRAWSTFF